MTFLQWLAAGACLASCAYLLLAIVAVRGFAGRTRQPHSAPATPTGITVLKPLCGLDPDLAGNLRSLCRQGYEKFQIICGVRDPQDPAIAVVQALMGEFPEQELELVVDERVHGLNLKVSNLINMYSRARNDIIVIADSDMRVTADYLAVIAAALRDERVGLVTFLYLGVAHPNLASRLGAMYINEWFLPSVLVADLFGGNRFCFGATMALWRRDLEALGGLEALADYLADDYVLGKAVCESGRRIMLAPMLVENVLLEPSLSHLFQHELRWARTIRSVQPVGYALSFLADTLPLALVGAALLAWAGPPHPLAGGALLLFALFLRTLLHFTVARSWNLPPLPWLCPVRDLLTSMVRIAGFLGGAVQWRRQSLHVEHDSHISEQR